MSTNVYISPDPLSIDDVYQSVVDKSCGGIVLFVGTARNHNKGQSVTHLDFEAYKGMAEKEMLKIAVTCKDVHNIKHITIAHREGHVGVTDIAVIIAVSSTHRKEAFVSCEYAIDALKANVPIWKKEFLQDGSYWVGARP